MRKEIAGRNCRVICFGFDKPTASIIRRCPFRVQTRERRIVLPLDILRPRSRERRARGLDLEVRPRAEQNRKDVSLAMANLLQ
jgi:hypothetical protein